MGVAYYKKRLLRSTVETMSISGGTEFFLFSDYVLILNISAPHL